MNERVPDSNELRELLRTHATAILALSSGGCARYIFSTEVAFTLTPDGQLLLTYDSGNPHHHRIMANSGMSLRILAGQDVDGTERCHLVFTGKLAEMPPPTPHGSDPAPMDPSRRHYRFVVRDACVEFVSGRRVPVDAAALGVAT